MALYKAKIRFTFECDIPFDSNSKEDVDQEILDLDRYFPDLLTYFSSKYLNNNFGCKYQVVDVTKVIKPSHIPSMWHIYNVPAITKYTDINNRHDDENAQIYKIFLEKDVDKLHRSIDWEDDETCYKLYDQGLNALKSIFDRMMTYKKKRSDMDSVSEIIKTLKQYLIPK